VALQVEQGPAAYVADLVGLVGAQRVPPGYKVGMSYSSLLTWIGTRESQLARFICSQSAGRGTLVSMVR
jgi:hypothetical protein